MQHFGLMSKRFLAQTSLFIALACAWLSFAPKADAQALLPKLSLTGTDNGFNDNFYSDGRIWLGSADNRIQEILVPVFINNQWWDSNLVSDPRYGGWPIYDFTFSVMYDGRSLEAAGVQANGFAPNDEILPGGGGFFFEWEDMPEPTRYNVYVKGQQDQATKYGRRVIVSGKSTRRLPLTEEGQYKILVYLKFKVILSKNAFNNNPTVYNGANKTAMYVSNDTIRYGGVVNELRVGKDDPFPKQSNVDPNNPYKQKFYLRDNNPTIGLAGITTDWADFPSRPGAIWVNINVDKNPQIGFTDFGISTTDLSVEVKQDANTTDGSLWNIVRPIVLDESQFPQGGGYRDVQVMNLSERSRITNILVQSDSPWLRFRTLGGGNNPIPSQTRQGVIPFIDNGINGEQAGDLNDATNRSRPSQKVTGLRVLCVDDDLRGLTDVEYSGVYVGYLTFTSNSALISPVRLRVNFIYFRNPLEPYRNPAVGREFGMKLTVHNSRGMIGDSVNLVFGTAHRATDGPDSLFGEVASEGSVGFWAKWFVPWLKDEFGNEVAPDGLGDIPIQSEGGLVKRSMSRDIRDYAVDTTLLYWCRFNADGAQNYPIIIHWDVRDLPDGAQLFLRDTLNGSIFSVDMRQGTPDPNYSEGGMSFTIRDAKIKSFVIEYTLPRVVKFPVINSGWNLLSLPVRPSDSRYKSIYPNSVNDYAQKFSQSQYSDEASLKPGVGYFVKYGSIIDSSIAGVRILHIDDKLFNVRLYPGWNTIGALSVSLPVSQIDFLPIQTFFPKLVSGVYAYKTNRGYEEVSELTPGIGYWIKVTEDGYLKLDAPTTPKTGIVVNKRDEIRNNSTEVLFSDNAQHQSSLYLNTRGSVNKSLFELPPTPMGDMYDVRFSSNTSLETATSSVIKIQGVEYPCSITIPSAQSEYVVSDAETGEKLGVISASNSMVFVKNANTSYIRIEELNNVETGITAKPNPANGTTMIQYSIASDEMVTVKLYNAIGVEIETLSPSFQKAGENTVELNLSGLPAGQYYCKVTAGNTVLKQTISVIR